MLTGAFSKLLPEILRKMAGIFVSALVGYGGDSFFGFPNKVMRFFQTNTPDIDCRRSLGKRFYLAIEGRAAQVKL
jgi:nucleoside recognition membrane protein YjiH